MDLQKPKKSRPDTHDQDDSSDYRVNGYGPAGVMDNDDTDPRQELEHEVTVKMDTKRDMSNPSSLQPLVQPPRLMKLSLRRRVSRITAARIPKGIPLDSRQKTRLRYADMVPPVTKETLSELDLERIMQNIQLRVDANFESGLHFLLDLNGEKGRQKKIMTDEYWEALSIEIMMYTYINMNRPRTSEIDMVHVPDMMALMKDTDLFQPRLPIMFETLHGILMTLVPEKDHPSVSQNLDISHLMQQVHKGVLDLVSLSKWLAELLKMHCAPMRDHLADEMAAEIGMGSTQADVGMLVSGLRKLFSMLEMMKLDVANHQLGAFQIILIENTIPFLHDYFSRRIISREFKVDETKAWYQGLQQRIPHSLKEGVNQSFYPLSVLLYGLSEHILQPDEQVKLPEPFDFDTARLWRLRSEVQKIIHVHVCWSILESLLQSLDSKRSYSSQMHASFVMRVAALLEKDNDSKSEPSSLGSRLPNDSSIAMEMARTICAVIGQMDDVSDDILKQVEDAIRKSFADDSTQLQLVRNCVHRQLLQATCEVAQRYVNMTPLEICESQRQHAYLQSSSLDFSFIATKLAHIGVLHWRVWAPLVYVSQPPIVYELSAEP
ncbi:cAMP-mediated signaling protein Sok1, putative [Talaromyces stipitatus ATCC 10500]|uniref:cAMP-mediated signaling protein Sok1, putative n=1 Tax=Talaromyces stipitatus (strain ATCC 10500 / CBS 375.48 / QM 6759 / NRRL 1006) TaxID=441959 RepID=B8LTW3_TALSN|nr:cAMP-mediated signaling protein Sok1, putative [Talaromyces stipitatus ATCC 10500]EED23793.1 cAMP-mediated signaling protein Sok1, putative [Talaromyces stipitatus ATCC 10500]